MGAVRVLAMGFLSIGQEGVELDLHRAGARIIAAAVLVDEGHSGPFELGGDLSELFLRQAQIARLADRGCDPRLRHPLFVIGCVDEVFEIAMLIACELPVDVGGSRPCRRVEFALGARHLHGPGDPLPPLLPTAPLALDLADELMAGELTQVIARRTGGLAEAFGQARRRLRTLRGQGIVDRHPQGMGQPLEGRGADLTDAIGMRDLADAVVRGLLAHIAKIHLQRTAAIVCSKVSREWVAPAVRHYRIGGESGTLESWSLRASSRFTVSSRLISSMRSPSAAPSDSRRPRPPQPAVGCPMRAAGTCAWPDCAIPLRPISARTNPRSPPPLLQDCSASSTMRRTQGTARRTRPLRRRRTRRR